MQRRPLMALLGAPLLAAAPWAALSQAASQMRLRGTIEKVEPGSLTLKERSGETLVLAMADTMVITEVVPIALADIQAGSYLGTTAIPGADGVLQAQEVHVFSEAQRGTGEGHRPMAAQPRATMTNATVVDISELMSAAGTGRLIKLKYKDGEKTVNVPPTVPVVLYKPGDRSLVVPGARVSVVAEVRDGKPVALRLSAGRNGFVPPT